MSGDGLGAILVCCGKMWGWLLTFGNGDEVTTNPLGIIYILLFLLLVVLNVIMFSLMANAHGADDLSYIRYNSR